MLLIFPQPLRAVVPMIWLFSLKTTSKDA